jgi:calcium/calmodulin-dependent protein kinase I
MKTPAELAASLPHTIEARYKLGDVLGEGGYSVVKSGISNIDGKRVAVKIITRKDLSEADEESLKQEVSILGKLNHPNITRLFDFFEEEKFYYVVLEYLDGGELFDRIVKKTYYSEKEARDLVFTVLKAIKYCHDQHIVHRDLKPENLLLASKNDDSDIKVADFGFATYAEGLSITSQCGTPGYIAPEILKSKPYGKCCLCLFFLDSPTFCLPFSLFNFFIDTLGKPADMWSFGVILYILLGGYPPFHDDNQRTLFRKICKGDYTFHPDYWSGVSSDAKDLIR